MATTSVTTTRPARAVIVKDVPLQELNQGQPFKTTAPNLAFRTVSDHEEHGNTFSVEATDDIPTLDEPRIISPKGPALAIVVASACLSLLLVELDLQIVATAVPAITDTFHTVADVGWYSSIYRLAVCSFQFMFGKLYRTYPLKTVFLIALMVFEMGSAICGAAPTSKAFVVGRVVAGLGTSGVFAGVFQMITVSFPLRYRPAVAGFVTLFEGISTIIAPTVGGLITQHLGWRWCFYINLPLGGMTLVLLMLFLKNSSARPPNAHLPWKQKIEQLDLVGTMVFIPAVTCLLVGLQYGATQWGWNDAKTIILFVASGTLLVAFAWVQWKRQDAAILPPRIIRRRSMLAGFCFSICTNSALNVVIYYLPTYFQVVRQMSPSKSGLMIIPVAAGFILAMAIAGPTISVVGFYAPFMLIASVMAPIASGLLTTLEVDGSLTKLVIYEVLFGLGCGIGFQSPQVAVQTTLSDADVSIGLNIVVFAQNFGPALFIGAAQSLFSSRLVSNLQTYAPDVDSDILKSIGLADIKRLVPASDLQEVLLGYDKAIAQTFYLSVGLTCLMSVGSLAMEWKSVKEKRN